VVVAQPVVVHQQEDELERVREADEVELGRVRDGRVLRVEGATEAPVGRALRSHEQMFARTPKARE
jgi:hypothetical protein